MKKIGAVVAVCLVMSGCSSIPMDPGANRIIASPTKPPRACKYLGQVVGNQGNFFTGGWTSNKNLEVGAMNDMKNQAAKLGANYVHLITNRAGVTGSMGGADGNFSGTTQQTNVTNMGNAYSCPPRAIGLN